MYIRNKEMLHYKSIVHTQKHIYMTNNVKSCKKINGRVQTVRFSVFTMGRQDS